MLFPALDSSGPFVGLLATGNRPAEFPAVDGHWPPLLAAASASIIGCSRPRFFSQTATFAVVFGAAGYSADFFPVVFGAGHFLHLDLETSCLTGIVSSVLGLIPTYMRRLLSLSCH